jgi:hypothetical protein
MYRLLFIGLPVNNKEFKPKDASHWLEIGSAIKIHANGNCRFMNKETYLYLIRPHCRSSFGCDEPLFHAACTAP